MFSGPKNNLHYLSRPEWIGREVGIVFAMFEFVEKILKRKNKGRSVPKAGTDYQHQKEALKSADVKDRLDLAQSADTHKEILYYLAEKDPEPKVRRAVANNIAMPVHASNILAKDRDVDVRLSLAKRLISLLPDLSKDKQSQLYAYAVQALGTLALDEVLKIRKALSSTLKDHAHTPPKVAGQLARDLEREVSEPILRFCAALADEDLLDILKSHPAHWVIEAVAGRKTVSGAVSDALIQSDHKPGGTILIGNEGAEITEDTLMQIVKKARSYPEWQKPVASRAKLPPSIAVQLAEFVDASVRDILILRDDFNPDDAEEIAAIFRRRLDFAEDKEKQKTSTPEQIEKLYRDGELGEEKIADALGMRDRDFVIMALARMGNCDVADVKKVFDMKAPKPIVALAWHAKLSMRMALQLQKEMGRIPPKELIYPKDGTDYPLTLEEIHWQLDFLNLRSE